MSVKSVIVNVTDVTASVGFYTEVLEARIVASSDGGAVLDVLTGTIELVRVAAGPESSTWADDSRQTGFRHIGFKVPLVDPVVDRARAAGAAVRTEPLDAFGDVRVGFFFDPDGTLLEVVEGDLAYTEVRDEAMVEFERALGVPSRPRLDHVATTTADLAASLRRWEAHGLRYMGSLVQPDNPRGFGLHYLRDAGTVVELMTFTVAGTFDRVPQVGLPGFAAAVVDGGLPAGVVGLGTAPDGRRIFADGDALVLAEA